MDLVLRVIFCDVLPCILLSLVNEPMSDVTLTGLPFAVRKHAPPTYTRLHTLSAESCTPQRPEAITCFTWRQNSHITKPSQVTSFCF